MKITIPKTIAAATKRLNGLGALLTASEWERAAIVYAFTEVVMGNQQVLQRQHLSIEKFAALGITGLRDRNTVRAYRKAWEDAIKDGAAEAAPGMAVTLPTRKFPDNPRSVQGTTASVRAALRKGTVTISDVIKDAPDLQDKVAEQIAEDEDTRRLVFNKYMGTPIPGPVATRSPFDRKPVNWNEDLWRGLGLVLPALEALKRDDFTPDFFNVMTLMLLDHVLPDAMKALAGHADYEEAEADLTDAVINDIEAFLKEAQSKKESAT